MFDIADDDETMLVMVCFIQKKKQLTTSLLRQTWNYNYFLILY